MKQQNRFIKNMNEQLISFETAKLAKEKGFFNGDIFYFFKNNGELTYKDRSDKFVSYDISAPTQSLLQKWLREKHHLIIIVAYQYEHDSTPYSYWIYKELQSLPINQWVNDLNTYEEALELGLQEALKLI